MLTKQAVSEFKEIYFEEYGIKITDEQAVKMGINLINAVRFLLTPQRDLDIYNERSKNEN